MLEYILNSKQKILILRLLITRPDWIFSASEISRELDIPKNTVGRNIKPLVEYNLIQEFKKGNATALRINHRNYIVKKILTPMYLTEQKYPLKAASEFCKPLKGKITAGMVFGSAAKKRMTPLSDIDLALISKDPKNIEAITEQLKSNYLKEQGLIFSLHIYQEKDFRKRYAKKDPLITDIANSIIVYGDIEKVI